MNLNFKVKTNPLHNVNYYLDIDFTDLDVTNAKKIQLKVWISLCRL